MEPVLAAMWKIIFPAILCLAETGTADAMKTTLPVHTNAETVATPPNTKLCRMDMDVTCTANTSSNGYSATISAAVNESAGTTAEESITLAPRNRMPDATFGVTTLAARDVTTANEHENAIARGAVVTHPAPSGVTYKATKNASGSISSFAASQQTPSSPIMTASSPGSATSPNGTRSVDTGNFTSLSPRMTTRAILTKTSTPDYEDITYDAKTRDPGDAAHLHEPYGNTPENADCYSTCDVIPAWATVLLCLATAFFLFMMVGFVFLLPYCTKLRHPTPGPCSA